MRVIVLLMLGVILSSSLQAGENKGAGEIAGIVEDDLGPVPFANVYISGTTIGAVSDLDGRYTITIPSGSYDVVASSIGYTADTVKAVRVWATKQTEINFFLSAGIDLGFEVVIEVEANKESQEALVEERKEAVEMVESLGAEAMSDKGVSDAKDAAKKMVGLSVVGSKHLYVRGLGDRYNSAYVNGLPVPSPDPDKRVIPLNLFPTSVISNMSVRKVGSPELYGDFAGASVDIVTKSYSEDPMLSISLGTTYNSLTTFKQFSTYEGSNTDWMGYDKEVRVLPTQLTNVEGYKSTSDGSEIPFVTGFDRIQRTAPVNTSMGLTGGNSYTFGKTGQSKFGFLLTGKYSNGYSNQFGSMRQFNLQNDTQLDYDFESSTYSTQSSGLGTVYMQVNPDHVFTLSTLAVNMSSDQVRDAYGFHFDYDGQGDVLSRRMSFKQNKLMTQRLAGEHRLFSKDRMVVKWSGSISNAYSQEPDRRQLVYVVPDAEYDGVYVFNDVDIIDNHRYYQDLAETEIAYGLNLRNYFNYQLNAEGDTVARGSIAYGYQGKSKSRDFGFRVFTYNLKQMNALYPEGFDPDLADAVLNQENHDQGQYGIVERTGVEAAHQAYLDVTAGYANFQYQLIPDVFNVTFGARYEMGDQRIIYRNQGDSKYVPMRVAGVDNANLLPSLSGRYKLPSDSLTTSIVKFGFFQSISRPGMRELAPFEYTEVFAGAKTMGNPELQNGTNYNADLRWEFYPETKGELIAIGLFGKILQNPIERILVASASGQLQTFENIDEAKVAGAEVEVTKNVGGMFGKDEVEGHFLNDMSLSANFSYLYSRISIDTLNPDPNKASIVLTNTSRPLQGASPYLLNVDLAYQKTVSENYKYTVAAAYNVFGRRVYAAGIFGLGDFYEASVSGLNIVWKNKFIKEGYDKWGLNLKLSNVLNPEIRIEQEIEGRTQVVNAYKRGIGVGLSFNYSFF